MDISKGRYWQKPWSLIDGCTPCSPGCDHCWSAAQSFRFNRNEFGWPVLTDQFKPVFNGDIVTHPDRLKRFNTRKPKVYALWNDLFWEE